MKGKRNRLILIACMALCLLLFSACAKEQPSAADDLAGIGATEEQVNSWLNTHQQNTETIVGSTDEELEQLLSYYQGDATLAMTVEAWRSTRDDLGAYVETLNQSYAVDGKNLIMTLRTKFEKAEADVEAVLDLSNAQSIAQTSYTINVDYSMSTQLARAGMNTLMGLGIVFVMLIFLSFIISLFKYIPMISDKLQKKKAPETPAPAFAAPAAPAVLEEEEEELVDDGELVAVIAAAVAASENVPVDGFVVRSIKKANRKNWQRA